MIIFFKKKHSQFQPSRWRDEFVAANGARHLFKVLQRVLDTASSETTNDLVTYAPSLARAVRASIICVSLWCLSN